MNMKRINDVPVIEKLGENSYVLVDNDGTAARIAGSKVGGGGGDVPLLGATAGFGVIDYATKEPVDFATGLDILTKRPILRVYAESMPETMAMFVTVLTMEVRNTGKYINAAIASKGEDGGTFMDVTLTFSDSEME